MKIVKTSFFSICFLSCLFSCTDNKQASDHKVSRIITLGNKDASYISIDLLGGAFIDFRLTAQADNPFSWKVSEEEMPANNRNGAVFQGHFLCLGRWGAPTEGEINAGVPHNGESGNKLWEVTELSGDSVVRLHSDALLDGIVCDREIKFDAKNAVFKVTDQVKSTISVGRLFNIVQHATLGTPFLAESTIIDSNAGAGFMQDLSYPDPHKYEYRWPNGIADTLRTSVDLTRTDIHLNYVSTHLFDEPIGWITAASPHSGALIGYIWNTTDYPWVNVWNQEQNGKPWAKGLEFGTCGIGRSYQDLISIDTRFHGSNSFFFLDAGETVKRSYICFQVSIPHDYKGVGALQFEDGKITLIEKGDDPRKTEIESPLTPKGEFYPVFHNL